MRASLSLPRACAKCCVRRRDTCFTQAQREVQVGVSGSLLPGSDLDRLLERRPVLPLDVGLRDAADRAEMDRVEAHLVVADAAAGVLSVGVLAGRRLQALKQGVAAGGEAALAAVD